MNTSAIPGMNHKIILQLAAIAFLAAAGTGTAETITITPHSFARFDSYGANVGVSGPQAIYPNNGQTGLIGDDPAYGGRNQDYRTIWQFQIDTLGITADDVLSATVSWTGSPIWGGFALGIDRVNSDFTTWNTIPMYGDGVAITNSKWNGSGANDCTAFFKNALAVATPTKGFALRFYCAGNPGDYVAGGISDVKIEVTTAFAWSTSNPTYPVTEVGPGILHGKFTVMSPRRMAINAVRVDTAHPGIRFHTTGRDRLWGQPMPDYPSMTVRTRRQTTRDFLSTSRTAGMDMVVAVNAAPWLPWEFPYNHQYAGNLGLAVSNGVLVCDGQSSPSFIVRDNLTMEMQTTPAGTGIASVAQAVSGFEFVLSNGAITGGQGDLNPRTALGLSEDRRYLYILTIDGRRSGHSDGATHYDLGQWLRYFGAWQGINMDGGGSTTLFSHQNGTANLLNWPSSSERANGSNLGIYYDAGPVQPGLPAASWPVKMADWLRYRGVSPGQSGPSDDAAGDGIPNLLKYAWNIDPLRGVQPGDPNGRPPHAEMTEVGGSPAFRFSWRRNRQATGLALFPEYSQTLAPGSWADLPAANIFQTGQDPVTGDTLHEARVDPAGADKFFLRMRAQGDN